jgi:hypothetical protein
MAISMTTAAWAIIIIALFITTAWAAITYTLLTASIPPVTGIFYAMVIKVHIRPWTAANDFITAI